MLHSRLLHYFGILVLSSFISLPCYADITRVYHPYVDPLESEIEFRFIRSNDDLNNHYHLYTLGYGQAVTDKLFIEGYINTTESSNATDAVQAFELEGLYQLTEKGSHYFDYGILVEAQRENKSNISDAGATLLLEKELGSSSLTVNLGMAYEYGAGIDNDINTLARVQWRYRYRSSFEPALELHVDRYDKCIGPAIMGLMTISKMHKIKWEAGLLLGLDGATPDTTIRALIEYEF